MTNRRFLRLLVRFQNAVEQRNDELAASFEMDREFDAGEFSGPAYTRWAIQEEERIAQRFGFTNADLAFDVVRLLRADVLRPVHLVFGGPAPLPR